MSEHTTIEWTDATWNPVTGCVKVSPGCRFCYAEAFAERFRGVPGHPYEQGFDLRIWPDRLDIPRRWKRPRRIFVNSMSDLFQDGVPTSFIDRVFDEMVEVDQHVYQVLTKRPERMLDYVRERYKLQPLRSVAPNIWLGTSIESSEYVARASIVGALSSSVRFLSCEPLLGSLDLDGMLGRDGVNWVIVGGESGRQSRAMNVEWVRAIRDQCIGAGVPFFFKQWGGAMKKINGRELDGRFWDGYPSG